MARLIMSNETLDDVRAGEDRLGRTLGRYRGQWVAVHRYEVVDSSPSLEALLIRLRGTVYDGGTFRVPERPGMSYAY